jgi:hypothetical protein
MGPISKTDRQGPLEARWRRYNTLSRKGPIKIKSAEDRDYTKRET